MNGKSIIILLISLLSPNVVHLQFRPSIVYHPGSNIMYKTDRGWTLNGNIIIKNPRDILKVCQSVYPNYNITNVMKMYQIETITNWCHGGRNCTRNISYDVHPFRCLNSTHETETFKVPGNCQQTLENRLECLSFDAWKNISVTLCSESYSYVMNMMQYSPCTNKNMMFSKVDIICCPADKEYYNSLLKTYLDGGHNERWIFSQLRHALSLLYRVKLRDLERDLCAKQNLIYVRHDKSSLNEDLENLKLGFKKNFSENKKWFFDENLKIERIHIQRIFDKVNNSCKPSMAPHQLSICVKQINFTLVQLQNHYKRTSNIHSQAYKQYLIREFENLFQNYTNIFKRANLTAKLQSVKDYLTSASGNLSYQNSFSKEYKRHISKCNNPISSDHSTSNSHATPIMSIVVTTVILLILIILTFIGTIAIKFCGQPFHRSTPNYVMSVVFDANQTQGPVPRSDQNLSENSNKQNVKLTLYENPIFNAKSATKPIEKQSLIENMES